jgi:uncharacterized protein (DUF427 family)
MPKAPGYVSHPNHKITESPAASRMVVEVAGEVIADSRHAVRVEEDGSPPRIYFPRADVRMDKLVRTAKTSVCPFKGTASYFSIQAAADRTLADAVWTYEDPYEEHRGLKDLVAFWEERHPGLSVRAA